MQSWVLKEKQSWWQCEKEGFSLQIKHSKPHAPRCGRWTVLRACRTWTKPFAHILRRSHAGGQIWLARGKQACGNERGKAPHLDCNQSPKPCTVCTSPSLVETPALHTSGSFWVKMQVLSTSCKERWPVKLPLNRLWLLQCSEQPTRKSRSQGRAAWCSQCHLYCRGMCHQTRSAGATSSSFPLLMMSMASFTTWPHQNFLPCCFLTILLASPAAAACQSQTLPTTPLSLAWANKTKKFSVTI